MLTVCAHCGTPHEKDTRCPNCKPTNTRDTAAEDTIRGNARARGYTTAWDRLSRRARTLQPWCTDCGTTHDLTVDHSPTAWDRHAAGQPIRLDDIDVVCRPCNSRRGAARGPNARPRPTVNTHRQALHSLADTPNPGGEGPNDPLQDKAAVSRAGKRHAYALAHPLERADNDPRLLRAYAEDRPHPTGVTIRTILAIDR